MTGTKNKLPTITVVVPVFNEDVNIAPLLAEIKLALKDIGPFEVIYVDDGSTDNSLKTLSELKKLNTELRVIHHHFCCGQSAAISTGVKMAKADIIATLDGDGQNDPNDIRALFDIYIKEKNQKSTLVTGARTKRQDNFIKILSSRIANYIRISLLNDDTKDTGCGLKIFSREVFLELPNFDHMHRFLPALIKRNGGNIISIPVLFQ